jgi:hypothetical protein
MPSPRTLLALTVLAALAAVGRADEERPAGEPRPDTRKTLVEMRTERLLAPPEREDGGAVPARPQPTASADDDAKVAPGLVRWHASADEARAAARTSGKPVLVFQMLGRLDDEFC